MEFDFQLGEIGKVVYAILMGGLIGLEREIAEKPAGLRTHMLVTGAATLLVILGDFMVERFGTSEFIQAIQADPIRIMEAIITGISFLGAGTIIFKSKKETVEGLTTAASILFAAGIGIAVALNQIYLATVITFLVIIILFAVGYIEVGINRIKNMIPKKKNNSDK